jgi:hypothetical protein
MRPSCRLVVVAIVSALAAAPLRAQAPRGSAEVSFGSTKVAIDYGSPGWSEERRAQMDRMVPVGAVWRMGADTRTTILVAGGAVRLGDLVLDEGGLGLNALRTGEKEWGFLAYDGGEASAEADDNTWSTPAEFAEKSEGATDRLELSFVDAGGGKRLQMRFGPMVLSAPIVPVVARDATLQLGGESVAVRWFSVKAADAPRPSAWTRAGASHSFFVDNVDCAFDVDWTVGPDGCAVRFRNRERARLADRIAEIDEKLARLKSAGGDARAERTAAALEADKSKLADELKELGPAPLPLDVEVPLKPAKSPSGKYSAELVRRGNQLVVVVEANDRAGEAVVDEKKLLPPAGKGGGD